MGGRYKKKKNKKNEGNKQGGSKGDGGWDRVLNTSTGANNRENNNQKRPAVRKINVLTFFFSLRHWGKHCGATKVQSGEVKSHYPIVYWAAANVTQWNWSGITCFSWCPMLTFFYWYLDIALILVPITTDTTIYSGVNTLGLASTVCDEQAIFLAIGHLWNRSAKACILLITT